MIYNFTKKRFSISMAEPIVISPHIFTQDKKKIKFIWEGK